MLSLNAISKLSEASSSSTGMPESTVEILARYPGPDAFRRSKTGPVLLPAASLMAIAVVCFFFPRHRKVGTLYLAFE
jgi:hypothetical protein